MGGRGGERGLGGCGGKGIGWLGGHGWWVLGFWDGVEGELGWMGVCRGGGGSMGGVV